MFHILHVKSEQNWSRSFNKSHSDVSTCTDSGLLFFVFFFGFFWFFLLQNFLIIVNGNTWVQLHSLKRQLGLQSTSNQEPALRDHMTSVHRKEKRKKKCWLQTKKRKKKKSRLKDSVQRIHATSGDDSVIWRLRCLLYNYRQIIFTQSGVFNYRLCPQLSATTAGNFISCAVAHRRQSLELNPQTICRWWGINFIKKNHNQQVLYLK